MLRILLVEDSQDDADLVRFSLEDAGLAFELRQVHTEQELRAALEVFEPHAAVSDLNIPGYCGAQALGLLRALHPRMPLVLLTGAEADAVPQVDAQVLGKDELARLPGLLGNATG